VIDPGMIGVFIPLVSVGGFFAWMISLSPLGKAIAERLRHGPQPRAGTGEDQGELVESVEQLRRMIREIPAGRTITMGISRDGQPLTVTAQLAQHSKVANMDQDFHFNMPAIHIPPINMPEMDVPVSVVVIHSPSRSGLMVESLTSQLGDFFGVKNGNGEYAGAPYTSMFTMMPLCMPKKKSASDLSVWPAHA